MTLDNATLDQCVQHIPPLPGSVQKALTILNGEEIDLQALEEVISSDIALTSRILKIANSPFYGLAGEIASIREASMVLGIHTLRSLILATGAMARLPPQGGRVIDRRQLWEHALATGIFAQNIAVSIKIDSEHAFTAGLLHDIGKLILDEHFPAALEKIISKQTETANSFFDAERALGNIDHCDIGATLLEHWHLPTTIVDAVRAHHQPNPCDGDRFNAVVNIANTLGQTTVPGATLSPRQQALAIELTSLTRDELSAFIDTNREQFQVSREKLF